MPSASPSIEAPRERRAAASHESLPAACRLERGEPASLACAISLLIEFAFFEIPLGLASTLIVAALIARRVIEPSGKEGLSASASAAAS
jgi:hypothetical protein